LFTTPSGLAVYPTVTIKTLNGDIVGAYTVDNNTTCEVNNKDVNCSILETKLETNKYYIFDMSADGYKEDKEVKYVNSDSHNLYFVLKPVNNVDLPPLNENHPPVVTLTYNNDANHYEFDANAYDEDGDILSYKWFIDGKVKDDCDNQTYCDLELENGTHTIKVDVSDDENTTSASISVDVNYTQPVEDNNENNESLEMPPSPPTFEENGSDNELQTPPTPPAIDGTGSPSNP
jgi:hypothetical protein